MLASLIAGFASGETLNALRRARRAAVFYLVAGLFIAVGIIFLLIAAFIWTAHRYGSVKAALWFGAGFVVAAIITLLIQKLTAETRAKRIARKRSSEFTTMAAASALAVLPTLMRGRVGLGALALPAAAFVAYAIYRENRPKRRPGSTED